MVKPRQQGSGLWRGAFVGLLVLGVAACDENGQFALPTAAGTAAEPAQELLPANALNQTVSAERDVERPDLFEITERGLWDGRPSLGGVWVAHPDVQDPERVLIRNTENGETIVGALFRRERETPGPAIQISSDAADALGALPGAPVTLYVVALRRQEVEVVVPVAEENPVVASLEAPVNVAAAPLEPAPVAEATTVAEDISAVASQIAPAVAETALEATSESAEAAATFAAAATLAASEIAAAPEPATEVAPAETIDVSSVFETPIPPANGPRAQIGVFSNERNANAAVGRIQEAGIAAEVLAETMGGQTVWRVVAGPLVNAAAVSTLQGLGYVDAFVLEDTAADTE